jgi:hypothetical protein
LRKNGNNGKIGTGARRKIINEKKKDAERGEMGKGLIELPILHPLLGGKYQAPYCQKLP